MGAMATETFQAARVLLSMEHSAGVYRDRIAAALNELANVALDEAEHLVAVAGEDERAYGPRDRSKHLDVLCGRIDEFLLDDDGGYFQMRAHLSRHERSDAVLEVWFHVARPGAMQRGTWLRHLIVGVDDATVYADMGRGG